MKRWLKITVIIIVIGAVIMIPVIQQLALSSQGDTDGDGIPNDIDIDDDGDGMPDWWEERSSLDPLDARDGAQDPDLDGIVNLQEYHEGTDPRRSDTDTDGLPDGWEIGFGRRDPVTGQCQPNPLASDAEVDHDHDLLTNRDEYLAGTDPNAEDTDGDGLTDGEELLLYDRNPRSSVGDWDLDRDGLNNIEELNLGTDRAQLDTDADGLSDWDEVRVYGTDPIIWDTDHDTMPDGWETRMGLDPLLAADAKLDCDHDRLLNAVEYQLGTHPHNTDSDGDGLDDGDEVEYYRTTPADPVNHTRRFAILVAPTAPGEETFKREIEATRAYLITLGYTDDMIVFLSSPDPEHEEPWLDGLANRTNLERVLDALATGGTALGTEFGNGSTHNDLVFIQLRDHGGGYLDHPELGFDPGLQYGRIDGDATDPQRDENDSHPVDADECFCTFDPAAGRFDVTGFWYDDEFAAALDAIQAHQLVLILDFCFSGGFVRECSAPGRVIATSTSENDFSGNRVYMFGERHTDPIYHHLNADGVRIGYGTDPINGATVPIYGQVNGVISIEESHAYTVLQIPASVQVPQFYDGLAGETYL